MNIPFTYEVVEGELSGQLVISRNKIGSNVFTPVAKVRLMENGDVDGASEWSVENGVLTIDMGTSGGVYEFNGMEARNGSVYATGLHNCERAVSYRSILHVASSLCNFGVCVSSNKNYEGETIPVIAKSLRRAGIDNDSVVVVVGDCRGPDKVYEKEGLSTIRTSIRAGGLNALWEASKRTDKDYWVLLHDTCTVSHDFKDKIASVDVGLNPDVVLFSGLEDGSEIGIYASRHLSTGVVELGMKPSDIMKQIIDNAGVVVDAVSIPKGGAEIDVYGCGVMTKAIDMKSVGVIKNSRRRGPRKRP